MNPKRNKRVGTNTRKKKKKQLLLGRIIGGKYQLLEEIDSSEKVRVFKAIRITDELPVIIKILQPRWLWDRILVTRYTREVQAVAALKHPSLVHILDVNYEKGVFYVATELVEGRDLFSMIHHGVRPSVTDAVDIVMQLARLLNYSIGKGVRYRTVKISNILLNKDGKIKVLAFNTPRSVLSRNMTGLKPNAGEDPDVFFLGVTLYQLLTMRFPLDRPDRVITDLTMARLIKISTDWSLRDVEGLKSEERKQLEAIIHKAVTFDIRSRFKGVASMLGELNRFATSRAKGVAEDKDMSSASGVIDAIIGMDDYDESPSFKNKASKFSNRNSENSIERKYNEVDESTFWKKKALRTSPQKMVAVGGGTEEEPPKWGVLGVLLAAVAALTSMVVMLW